MNDTKTAFGPELAEALGATFDPDRGVIRIDENTSVSCSFSGRVTYLQVLPPDEESEIQWTVRKVIGTLGEGAEVLAARIAAL